MCVCIRVLNCKSNATFEGKTDQLYFFIYLFFLFSFLVCSGWMRHKWSYVGLVIWQRDSRLECLRWTSVFSPAHSYPPLKENIKLLLSVILPIAGLSGSSLADRKAQRVSQLSYSGRQECPPETTVSALPECVRAQGKQEGSLTHGSVQLAFANDTCLQPATLVWACACMCVCVCASIAAQPH